MNIRQIQRFLLFVIALIVLGVVLVALNRANGAEILNPKRFVRPNSRGILTYQPVPKGEFRIVNTKPPINSDSVTWEKDPQTGQKIPVAYKYLIRNIGGVKVIELIQDNIRLRDYPVSIYIRENPPARS